MAIKLADVFVNITGDSKGLDREFARVKKSAGAFGNVLQGVLQGVGQAAFRSMTRGLGAVVGEMGRAVNAASDLQETLSKTTVVFGESAQEVLAWGKTTATALGLSQKAALDAASTIGNMFVALGEQRDMAAGVSMLYVEMAADLASFHNVAGGAEEVLVALQSAFRGEYDALQRYIPTISAATVEQQAFIETGKDNAKQLTALEKAHAVQAIVLRDGATAWGDFERTIGSVTNQTRIFQSQMEDARGELGQAFTPAIAEILQGLNELIRTVRPYGSNLIDAFVTGMTQAINTRVIPILMRLRAIFDYWLRAHSPPRLLPDLSDWGRGAMEAYLAGWSQADLGVLEDLGRSLQSVIRSFAGAGSIKETDLVSRVFGTRRQIVAAMDEFRRAGSVSASTLAAIQRAAGPAGGAVRGLVSAYFDLQSASRAAAQAQEELTAVTERYDDALAPINDKLRAVQNQQADIRDQQRAAELGAEIADINTSASDRRLAQLELEEIELRRQQRLLEEERDTAVGAAEDKLEAAREEERARQDAYNRQQALIDQQVEANRLIEEEAALRERLAAESLAAQEKALRELEQAQKELERAEKDRKQELERIYQAQLAYNMQIADTPGKIALLKQELGRYTEGSAEYYDILTQIAALEQQLARERESGAAGPAAGVDMLDEAITQMEEGSKIANAFADAVERAFNVILGKQEDEWQIPAWDDPLGKNKPIGPIEDPLKAMLPQWLRDLIDALNGVPGAMDVFVVSLQEAFEPIDTLVTKLDTLMGVFDRIKAFFDWWGKRYGTDEVARIAAADVARDQLQDGVAGGGRGGFEALADDAVKNLGRIDVAMGDTGRKAKTFEELVAEETEKLSNKAERNLGQAEGHFTNWGQTVKTTGDQATADLAQDLADQKKAVDDKGPEFEGSGKSLIAALWSGMSVQWTTESNWWTKSLQWIKDMLPGSEPKALDSPLRGLKSAGEAIISNIFSGMKAYWDRVVQPWLSGANSIWAQIRAYLPGSEPQNPASPLRNLGDAGAAIVENMMRGMEQARISVTPQMATALAGPAAGQVVNNYFAFDQVFSAQPDWGLTRAASRDGVLAALRTRGA